LNTDSNKRPQAREGDTDGPEEITKLREQPGLLARSIQTLLHMGLGEFLLRATTNIFSVVAIVIVVWLAQTYFRDPVAEARAIGQSRQAPAPVQPLPAQADNVSPDASSFGIVRGTSIHTLIPARPRQEIITYAVQKGDSVSGIADKYGLQPKTIFAANYDFLQDNPENLQPGQTLKILPVDGV
jgi:nucleoid-associated protein YgaU